METIGPYILGKTLGEGTTGKVKQATHKDSKQQVAIKILKKSNVTRTPAMRRKVEREITVMKLFDHPNVLHLMDVYQNSKYIFLILEYVEGGELFDYVVRKGKLTPEEAFHFFRQIIQGVEYCHNHLVCHRDLKLENLLVDKNNNIKIADFGMANMMNEQTLLETSCGSPHYASPQVARGEKYNGMEADVWSMGVILYALVCGRLPFDDDDMGRLLAKVRQGQYTIPEYLEKNLRDLISKMLERDPNKRIKIKDIKKHKWWRDMEKKTSQTTKPSSTKFSFIHQGSHNTASSYVTPHNTKANEATTHVEPPPLEDNKHAQSQVYQSDNKELHQQPAQTESAVPDATHCENTHQNKDSAEEEALSPSEDTADDIGEQDEGSSMVEAELDAGILRNMATMGWLDTAAVIRAIRDPQNSIEKVLYKLLLKRKQRRDEGNLDRLQNEQQSTASQPSDIPDTNAQNEDNMATRPDTTKANPISIPPLTLSDTNNSPNQSQLSSLMSGANVDTVGPMHPITLDCDTTNTNNTSTDLNSPGNSGESSGNLDSSNYSSPRGSSYTRRASFSQVTPSPRRRSSWFAKIISWKNKDQKNAVQPSFGIHTNKDMQTIYSKLEEAFTKYNVYFAPVTECHIQASHYLENKKDPVEFDVLIEDVSGGHVVNFCKISGDTRQLFEDLHKEIDL